MISSDVRITRCGSCDEQFTYDFYFSQGELDLAPGVYAVEFMPAGDSIMWFEIEYLGESSP